MPHLCSLHYFLPNSTSLEEFALKIFSFPMSSIVSNQFCVCIPCIDHKQVNILRLRDQGSENLVLDHYSKLDTLQNKTSQMCIPEIMCMVALCTSSSTAIDELALSDIFVKFEETFHNAQGGLILSPSPVCHLKTVNNWYLLYIRFSFLFYH